MRFEPEGISGQGGPKVLRRVRLAGRRRSIHGVIRLSFRTILRNQLGSRTNGQTRNLGMPDVLDSQIQLTMFVFDRALTRPFKEQRATSDLGPHRQPQRERSLRIRCWREKIAVAE
jgi:hypothetical protein